ncbi:MULTISPECIES: chloramphenicol phosphotransferase CPT [Streptomyces]|uniref:Chloramphenicol phosphotransferase CPT n=1 Tax=Streptomyces caniscabiei TaxID=2746961 RepID=A0ABU4MR67_9ACTN|nr:MULTISPECIES: chloramphenicol phosphotransferase CPT [Streptomyces]MBE4738356.1 chloramphenicol phosphotransferase CPT [Streptomyces caniscabiei]MBE4757118.1 chloramphenicol phosphotransferase CPT [Streptomyces caniscabiei]MBE4770228.1 chloramphenicol phosphotransferase CPT [Streptomyces caniscabiei]MBE4785372.1 chloramphenicol phosphotransferase CPT [Streptomyces caniscabiei]MBE4796714.1 chloramphenicol phosphotransferase CPT [Streptomyces caniscabiei]
MTTRMIILNGGSSSGKSGIVRCLQAELPDQWLAFGADSLIDAMPARMQTSDGGIEISADGEVAIGADFRALEQAWARGVVAMARAGARIVVDDIFLGGAASQQRWQNILDLDGSDGSGAPLDVLWVGVRCAPDVAAARETARGDRVRGMAAAQADLVHRGVHYDLEVETTHTESLTCARTIATHLR